MSYAESDGMRLAYTPETVEGVTDATPVFQIARFTRETFKAQKQTIMSEEIRADKNLAGLIAAGEAVGGGYEGEMSYGTYDDLFEGLMRASFGGDVLINGLERKSFTFEKTTEEGATDSHLRYRGCFIDSLNINMQPRQPIKLSWGVLGMGADDADAAIITGATYTSANTNDIFPTGTHVGSIAVAGIAALPAIRSLDLTIKSNLREQLQIGSNDLAGVALGRFEVTGTLGLYFEGIEVYNAIRAHDVMGLVLPLGQTTGEKYELEIGTGYFLEGDPVAGGNGQDVAFDVQFQATFDAGDAGSMKLTRAIV